MEKKFEVDEQTFIGGGYMSEEICDGVLDFWNENESLKLPGIVANKETEETEDVEVKKCTQLDVIPNAQELILYNIHLQAILDDYKQKY